MQIFACAILLLFTLYIVLPELNELVCFTFIYLYVAVLQVAVSKENTLYIGTGIWT